MPKLSVELVPKTCFWTNVRSNVSRNEWSKCKQFVRKRSESRCEICGGVGARYPVDCHEIWEYDDEAQVQRLAGLIALCPPCHEVKHIGRAIGLGNGDRAVAHLCRVNEWSPEKAETYLTLQFEIWQMRSTHQWELDISYLSEVLHD